MCSAKYFTFGSGIVLAALCLSVGAAAEEASVSRLPADLVAAAPITQISNSTSPSAARPVDLRSGLFGSKPLPAESLAADRGGSSVFNDNQLKGVVANNQANNLTTGMNVISDGAFSGAAGLSTVIQNSGNNVLIQNATIVNVQLK